MTAIAVALILSFGLLFAIHVVGSLTLARRGSAWRGALAFVLPPFFPFYAVWLHRAGWAIAWCGAAAAYVGSLAFAWSWR